MIDVFENSNAKSKNSTIIWIRIIIIKREWVKENVLQTNVDNPKSQSVNGFEAYE